eukprot:TRINITY_DN20898_c0_g1_i1.p1 TRINITY_DN20898_c0_g1~~TRINITY_DN20898_c0_g1_i1.p1  ORF type:complete len:399 (+),score=42.29 TRINITY_DN20898_c0_g1_i1:54-1250(+)
MQSRRRSRSRGKNKPKLTLNREKLWKLLADGAGEGRMKLQQRQVELQKNQHAVIRETMELLGEYKEAENNRMLISPPRTRPGPTVSFNTAGPTRSFEGRVSPVRRKKVQRSQPLQPMQPTSYLRPSLSPEKRVAYDVGISRSPPTPVLVESTVLSDITVDVLSTAGERIYSGTARPDTTVYQFLAQTIQKPLQYVVRVSGIPINQESRIGNLFVGSSPLQLCIEKDNDVTSMFAKQPQPVNAPVLETIDAESSKAIVKPLEYDVQGRYTESLSSVSPSMVNSQVQISQVHHHTQQPTQPIQPLTPTQAKTYCYFQVVVDDNSEPILLRLLASLPLSSLFASRSLAKYAGSTLVWGSTTLSLSKSPSHYNMPTAVDKPIRLTLLTKEREDLSDFEQVRK